MIRFFFAEWNRQWLGEEFDEFQHLIGDRPEHIYAAFERVTNANAAAAAADSRQWQSKYQRHLDKWLHTIGRVRQDGHVPFSLSF